MLASIVGRDGLVVVQSRNLEELWNTDQTSDVPLSFYKERLGGVAGQEEFPRRKFDVKISISSVQFHLPYI